MQTHIFLEKKSDNAQKVIYLALSRDFATDRSLQSVALIEIDKLAHRFEFTPIGVWAEKNVLDPHFYECPEGERAQRYGRDYSGLMYGAWTVRIYSWVTRLMAEGRYPDEAPHPQGEGVE